MKFQGKNVASAFQHESGKHCCQRVPITESKGRRHTSIISVAVLPIKENTYEPLNDKDLEITTQGGHGCGGQHQNATDSAVRMVHKPTGLKVFINGRKQLQNKKEARKILTARVNALSKQKVDSHYNADRKNQMNGGGRGDKVRTYNFINCRVVCHKLGRKSSQIHRIMRGEFHLILGKN